jgi:hypothetical protein
MLKYPRLVVDLSLTYPLAIGKAVFYTSNVRAKVRRGTVRQCWISEAQLKRVCTELEQDIQEGEELQARDIDGMIWRILIDRPRKR